MNFAATPEPDADIEGTLVQASHRGLEDGDLRLLSILTTWIEIHHSRINADKLVCLVLSQRPDRVRAYWAAVGMWLGKDRRFARVRTAYKGEPLDLLPVGTHFQIARRGEDERFAGSPLQVPRGTLRHRVEDVLSPEALVRRHAVYRNRVVMGSSYRADVWAMLEKDPGLSISEAAWPASYSFAAAWPAAQDLRLLHRAGAWRPGEIKLPGR